MPKYHYYNAYLPAHFRSSQECKAGHDNTQLSHHLSSYQVDLGLGCLLSEYISRIEVAERGRVLYR